MSNSKSQTFANNQNSRFNPQFPQIGVVMDNRDPSRTGKLKIWIKGSQSQKESKGSWITASYLAPFAGRTPGVSGGAGSYTQYPKGYGFWAVPPDVGTMVGVIFANGNIHDAWWFGGAYDERMNTMVPGSATQTISTSGYDMPVPITDYDRNTSESNREDKYPNVPLVEGLRKQNLLYDSQKGTANRSSTRQTISTVYGMSSPRGNTFILDDGYTDAELTASSWDDDKDGYQDTQASNPVNDTTVGGRKNEGIVLRTRSGAQFLLSESDGNVFVINRDGTARIEMTADGQITAHSDKSITIRTDEDFNLTAKRDINIEAGRNFNMHVLNDSKLNLVNNLDTTVGQEVVINTGSEFRLVSTDSIRIKTGNTFNVTSSSTLSLTSSSVMNYKGTALNLSSSGTTLSINDSTNSSTVVNAPDLVTPQAGFNEHSHNHKEWESATSHSNEMDVPYNGGGSVTYSDASDALPADDVASVIPTVSQQEEVQHINGTSEIGSILANEVQTSSSSVTYTTTYEALQMVMPCTGTIREYGYWGKSVATSSGGTTNRNGWIIQCKGDVVSPEEGLVSIIGSTVVVTHKNGYKSVFRGITATANNQDYIDKGSTVGTASAKFTFEIRLQSSALYGFTGTVDPGLFYSTVTGTGADCANKSLTAGEVSNSSASVGSVSYSENSSDLVVMTNVNSIGSAYSQRGSRYIPGRTTRKSSSTSNSASSQEDLSNVSKEAIDWVVVSTDAKLLEEVKEFEGTLSYQAAKGFYRNGKFWTYRDSLGYPTIGYGHLVQGGESFGSGLTEDQADQLLSQDLASTVTSAKSIYARYNMRTPYLAQIVLVEMVYQMGKGGVLKFEDMLKAMAAGNYKVAAQHIRSSKWYRQTTRRAEIMARRLEACQ